MIAGSLTALVWTWLGKPFGIHGFLAGSAVALVGIVLARHPPTTPHIGQHRLQLVPDAALQPQGR